jgi:exodeoxyribonuclease V beta subunit
VTDTAQPALRFDVVSEPEHFDVCAELPGPGVTVLEASAGTGKTFTIAALVTRAVAEGLPVSEILAVTFTRLATGELRDRVRARLVSAEEGLARYLDFGQAPSQEDTVLCLLASGTDEEVACRRERLATALTVFDEATITTTHGFCQLMLAGLGVTGDVATGATLLEDPGDLVEEVVDDLYVRWTLLHGGAPPFTRREALAVARAAVANPETPIAEAGPDPAADLRRRLADGVRREVERRLREGNLLTFDDLLVRLEQTLADEARGEAAARRLRARYRMVLVDEFQDTDPIQWNVVRKAFGTGETTLVLIGDPKQAIYAFRGADVYAYLEAARLADRRFTLGRNWRSDADLLAAFDALLDPLRLGHPEIPFRRVEAVPAHHRPGLSGAPVSAALRARVVHVKDHQLPMTRYDQPVKHDAVRFVARDLATDVVRLLQAGPDLVTYADNGAERSRRPLRPGDVAVLVATNRQAHIVQDALRSSGVPAVVAGVESVLTTPAATEWLRLLEAMEQPASRSRAVAIALTPFLGMTAGEVATADEARWEEVHTKLHRWSEILRRRGVASLFRSVLAREGVPGRLLRERDGERRLTDLGHIAQLLHAEASRGQHGPPALRAWLARRIDEAVTGREGADAEERSRWLDSDANAVQVLTVHRSKGLEFPIVYCPFLWDENAPRSGSPVVYHDPDGGARTLDVSCVKGNREYERHVALYREEERGESLRELYVALTRARHQAVIWWVRAYDAQHSALGRLLMARDADGNVATSAPRMPRDEEVDERLLALSGHLADGLISVERAGGPEPGIMWPGRSTRPLGPLDVAAFDRSLDLRWRRTSYSGITSLVHGGPDVGSEPEDAGTSDEPLAGAAAEVVDASGPSTEDELRRVKSLWADLPGGVDMGTFVHKVLEEADFAAEDLMAELSGTIAAQGSRYAAGLASAELLAGGLHAALTTPLGPVAGGIALREVGRGERLDEMGFELPIAGGDEPSGDALATRDIARLFELHAVDGGPLEGYAERLRDPLLGTDLRGYLTGSLDLVFRVREGGRQRYLVADYKTNWIGGADEELTMWHYRPAALDAEMQRMHYPLQAIFYMVALHRYLRWRVPRYSPESHLGGVMYLFLRGMSGPGTPLVDGETCGVFAWRPPAGLVTDLSDLFEAGS